MGARGLLNYIRRHRDTRSRSFSLESIAYEKGGKAIVICDFISVIIWLLESFHEGIVKAKEFSQYSHMHGADYEEYAKRILQFVEALQCIKVRPVFFADGPRGSANSDMEVKLQAWLDGQRGKHCVNAHVIKFCQYDDINGRPFSHRIGLRSLFLHYVVEVLQKHGVEVVICNGEADRFMAEHARENPNVCGILTSDTDLAMMTGCSTIHCKFFDRADTLKLRLPVMNVKPDDIRCETIDPVGLARSLGIPEECLPALSILCGNDYTRHYTEDEEFRGVLEMTPPYVEWAANWIQMRKKDCKSARQFLLIPEIRRICDRCPHYGRAVTHCYRFYGDSISTSAAPSPADVHTLVPEIMGGKLNMQFLSIINCSVYWNNATEMLPDEKASDDVCAKLLPVRKCMYSLLSLRSVAEYGLHHHAGRKDVPVRSCPASLLSKLRTALSPEQKMMSACAILISQDQLHQTSPLSKGLQSMCDRIMHDNTASELPRFNSYMVSLLVYASIVQAFKLNVITEETLAPALLTCICSSVAWKSPKMALRPTAEAVVCASRLACIVEHAYYLASLLGLHSKLPLSVEVFKASIYVPFHMMEFKRGRCHGEDEKLQSLYKGLSVSVIDMERLKILVKCGEEAGITAFADAFGSSQAQVKECLNPVPTQPPRKVKSKSHH